MSTRLNQFFSLVGLAVTELFRQPAVFLLILVSTAITVLVPLAIFHQLGQENHLTVDSSLAFEFVFGVILAGYSACATLHNECRSGTILILFSKPVSRLMFFLAKYMAVSILLGFFVLCSTAASLLAERLAPRMFEFDSVGLILLLALTPAALLAAALLNFLTRRPFVSHAMIFFALVLGALVLILGMLDREGHRVAFGSMMEWRLIRACLLEGLALLLLATIAISLAGRLPSPATVAILTAILFAGLISDHLVSLLPPSPVLRYGLQMVLPDIQAFWPADRLAGSGTLSLATMLHAAAYAATYGAGALCLGYAAFRNRQF